MLGLEHLLIQVEEINRVYSTAVPKYSDDIGVKGVIVYRPIKEICLPRGKLILSTNGDK